MLIDHARAAGMATDRTEMAVMAMSVFFHEFPLCPDLKATGMPNLSA
jgi:hypothetical protein